MAAGFKAEYTPEIFVFDKERKLRYHGSARARSEAPLQSICSAKVVFPLPGLPSRNTMCPSEIPLPSRSSSTPGIPVEM